jgi:hypothetical protein
MLMLQQILFDYSNYLHEFVKRYLEIMDVDQYKIRISPSNSQLHAI